MSPATTWTKGARWVRRRRRCVTPHDCLLIALLTQAQKPRIMLRNGHCLCSSHKEKLLLKAGITGKGCTIMLIDGSTSPILTADVHLYDALYGLKDPKINVIAHLVCPHLIPMHTLRRFWTWRFHTLLRRMLLSISSWVIPAQHTVLEISMQSCFVQRSTMSIIISAM